MNKHRFIAPAAVLAVSALLTTGLTQLAPTSTVPAAVAATAASADTRLGSLDLLTDPFLQLPTETGVSVVWMTEVVGSLNAALVGAGVETLTEADVRAVLSGESRADVTVVTAETMKLSRVAEDSGSNLAQKPAAADGIVERDVWRHEAVVTGLEPGVKVPYRVVTADGATVGASAAFRLQSLPKPGDGQRILLTSDHQAMINTPANLQIASETVGDIDAVFFAGDLINIPDRASEWFDDSRGSAFFPVLQGRGGRVATNGQTYNGGAIIQEAPVYPAIGNHEVQGRIDGMRGLNASFNAPVPVDVVEREYKKVAATVNPTGDAKIKAQWIEDNSFSSTTYEEIFSLPESETGGEKYYATTVGDVRLVSLYSTRIWRGTTANPNPEDRNGGSRYQESKNVLDKPLEQGYGEFVFEDLEHGSEQYNWLEKELESPEFKKARYRVVLMHEGPQGLGDNVMPVFAHPERIETRDASGKLTGVRYEYRRGDNMLVNDVQPLLEKAGVDLVHNGHSHLWNRFASKQGVNYIETSNTGNTYGAYDGLSGRTRPVPPAPWDASNYMALGNPGGLKAIVPSENPFTTPDGAPQPYVQSNNHVVFTVLDTGANEVVSYVHDMRTPEVEPVVLDRFSLGRINADLAATTSGIRHGGVAKIAVTADEAVTGDVVVRQKTADGTRVVARGTVTDGRGTVEVPARTLRPGTHALTVEVAGNDVHAPATAAVELKVAKAATRVQVLKVKGGSTAKVIQGRKAQVQVRVEGSANGTVIVRSQGKQIGQAVVRNGRATVALKPFKQAGNRKVVVQFRGTNLAEAASVTRTVKVARR